MTVEQIPVNNTVISTLISTSSGDLQHAITYLQLAAHLSNTMDPPTPILPEDIQEIAGIVPNTVVCKFAQTLRIDIPLNRSGDDDVEMGDVTPETTTTALHGFDLIRETVKSLI